MAPAAVGVTWYLAVATLLFGIGATGVLIRRNAIVGAVVVARREDRELKGAQPAPAPGEEVRS